MEIIQSKINASMEKKINTKKYISEYHTCKNLNTLAWTVFDDYYVCCLLLGNKYKCIDEYVKIIKVYGLLL